jgi:hypothetical protein
MANRQTRIFVPSMEPLEDWAETLIGKVLRPLTEEHTGALEWFWFSRYGSPADESGDCDIALIPNEFKQPLAPGQPGFHRSMRFRFRVADNTQGAFEQRAQTLINDNGYRISDFREYDFVSDTGNNRFLGTENRQPRRAEQRAALAVNYYHAISKLVIDALVGPSQTDRFRMETNDDLLQNPRGSTFQSLLHLFCNMTSVPTDVYVFKKGDSATLGTFMYPPSEPPEGWDNVTPVSIRY